MTVASVDQLEQDLAPREMQHAMFEVDSVSIRIRSCPSSCINVSQGSMHKYVWAHYASMPMLMNYEFTLAKFNT